jgi:phosphatidylglycerophosphate synthase
VLDNRLRTTKERTLGPVARALAPHVDATVLSVLGALCCVGSGVAAWAGRPGLGLGAFALGRLLDGLDGAVARAQGRACDLGGFHDIVLDTVGYAAVPLGLAAGSDTTATWAVVAVLLATFYVNAVSWTYLSALLHKRSAETGRGELTSVTMPVGLVEGTETIVLFVVALARPALARPVFAVMAAGVAFSVVQRVRAAQILLHDVAGPSPRPVFETEEVR